MQILCYVTVEKIEQDCATPNLAFEAGKKKKLKVNTFSARPHVAAWVRGLYMCSITVYGGRVWSFTHFLFYLFFSIIKYD